MITDCLVCANNDCLIKRNISEAKVLELSLRKRVMKVKKNKQFITEGAMVSGLFFIYTGVVKVYKTGLNDKEQILRFSRDGEIIGYRGFGIDSEYQIGSVVIEDTVLCFFSISMLDELFHSVPKLTFDFMRFFSDELVKSEDKVRKIAQMTVREKVIDALLYVNRKFAQKNGAIGLKLSRKDIAGFAGTTEEQVIRVISSLDKEGILYKRGKQLAILDLDKLKREIAEHNFYLSS